MSPKQIIFSPRAQQRLEEIAAYLSRQQLSNTFVRDYLKRFENYLLSVLSQFPESGTRMPEFGKDVRRVVYQEYSFLYRIKKDVIEILTIFRENRP